MSEADADTPVGAEMVGVNAIVDSVQLEGTKALQSLSEHSLGV